MTMNDYWNKVMEVYLAHRDDKYPWRYGQAAFNVLWDLNPQAADLIAGTDIDPFYLSLKDLPSSNGWKNFEFFIMGFFDED